jgi:hypothetical protein
MAQTRTGIGAIFPRNGCAAKTTTRPQPFLCPFCSLILPNCLLCFRFFASFTMSTSAVIIDLTADEGMRVCVLVCWRAGD